MFKFKLLKTHFQECKIHVEISKTNENFKIGVVNTVGKKIEFLASDFFCREKPVEKD